MKTLILLAVAALSLHAQTREYVATADTTALTIQKRASDPTQIAFHQAWVYCASAATATLSWNGTAASATTLAPVRLPGTQLTAAATAWSGSNVGSGTTGPVYNVPAGATFSIDLSLFRMGNTGTGTNVTIATSGTCTISFSWGEN
jgi:hypothetical protein